MGSKSSATYIEDVRDGVVDSRELNKASDIKAYFDQLPKELQPKKSKPSKPRAFREIDIRPQGKSPAKPEKRKTKTKTAPRPRKTLAPRRHTFNIPSSTKGQTLLREASSLDADRFRLSAAFVLRGFVELAINDYMEFNSIPKVERNAKGNMIDLDLSQRADRVVKHVVASCKFRSADLRGFRSSLLTKSSTTSIQSLNGFIHNKFQIPAADALRAGWDASVPIFSATYGIP